MADENSFVDAERNSMPGQGTSFKDIILRHIERIAVLSAKEMRGGYYASVLSGGTAKDEWVPDPRNVYVQAVRYLCDTLYAHFPKDIKKVEDEEEQRRNAELSQAQNKTGDDAEASIFYMSHRRIFRAVCEMLKAKNYLELGGHRD